VNKTTWTIIPAAALILAAPAAALAQGALPKTPPIPKDNPMTPEKISLGKQLYFDTRLSGDNTVSCQTCHVIAEGGDDGLPVSEGIGAQRGGRNAPTVWNAAYLSVQFWDGRADTLEDQAKGPITNPIEMGMPTHDVAVEKVKQIPGYAAQFDQVFGGDDPVTIDNVAKAIAAFERTLVTPDTRYDRYERGDEGALTEIEKKGLATFKEVGCTTCHSGPAFAGPPLPMGTGFYMKFPTYEDNPYVEKHDFKADVGRAEPTGDESMKHFWRIPTLRNVAHTAPYFHNGAVSELPEAVRVMGKTQLNLDLTDEQVEALVAFLKSISPELPKVEAPDLPE